MRIFPDTAAKNFGMAMTRRTVVTAEGGVFKMARESVKRRRAQSVMEYSIVVVAIIVGVIVAAKSMVKPAVQNIIGNATQQAEQAALKFKLSTNQ